VAFEIRGRDSKALHDFYRALFNWEIEGGEAISRSKPGIGGPIEGVGGVFLQADTPGVSVYVQVANLRESLEQAEALGGKKVLEPTDIPGGPTIARIQDPEGNFVGLIQQ
jgi:predicted enzyme related to lactoylglutathione lyase